MTNKTIEELAELINENRHVYNDKRDEMIQARKNQCKDLGGTVREIFSILNEMHIIEGKDAFLCAVYTEKLKLERQKILDIKED